MSGVTKALGGGARSQVTKVFGECALNSCLVILPALPAPRGSPLNLDDLLMRLWGFPQHTEYLGNFSGQHHRHHRAFVSTNCSVLRVLKGCWIRM